MLYIVATPIGNLEDMTFRAVRTLKEVNYIFAEDTRVTRKLLNHYEIENTVYRYDEHTKMHQIANIINLLKEGKDIALVTDAGTPCISDPGYELVDAAHNEGIRVVPIPAHRPQDHITLEMAPLEIRHRSVRPISAKHAQASRFLQQSPHEY